jgi:anti-sigma28 factor (negative regulator of flagellin synthesis)
MNPIHNVGGNQPAQKVTSTPIQKQVPPDAAGAGAAAKPPLSDRVELSGVGPLLSALKSNDIRADKVASVKAQIEAGTYEDEKKLDAAVDRLLDDLTK